MGQKQKKSKKLHILLVLVLVIFCGYKAYELRPKEKESIDNTKVLNTITQELKINTVKYNYTNTVSVEKNISIKDFKIPFTDKSFVIKYNGVINAGVDPNDIKIVSNDNNEINLDINKCTILDHYIDDENVYISEINSSIFNKIATQEVLDDISKYKKEYEQKVLDEGFMIEVESSTKKSLEKILKEIGYEVVNINFK